MLFFLILEAKEAAEVTEASDSIMSVEVIEVFRSTEGLEINNIKARIILF